MRIRGQNLGESEENVLLALSPAAPAVVCSQPSVAGAHSSLQCLQAALSSAAEGGGQGSQEGSETGKLFAWQTLANCQLFPISGHRGQAPAGRYVAWVGTLAWPAVPGLHALCCSFDPALTAVCSGSPRVPVLQGGGGSAGGVGGRALLAPY